MFYFASDIRQGLVATTAAAVRAHLASGAPREDYLAGLLDLAQAQAALYGIPWPPLADDLRASLGADAPELAWGFWACQSCARLGG